MHVYVYRFHFSEHDLSVLLDYVLTTMWKRPIMIMVINLKGFILPKKKIRLQEELFITVLSVIQLHFALNLTSRLTDLPTVLLQKYCKFLKIKAIHDFLY